MLDHASYASEKATRLELVRVTHDTSGPRAILLSPDEKTLYVADGDAERGNLQRLCSYPVKPDGELGHVKVMIDFVVVERGIEGMCLDSEGNIIACAGWKKAGAGPMLYVISPSGTIWNRSPRRPTRCFAHSATAADEPLLTAAAGGSFRSKTPAAVAER